MALEFGVDGGHCLNDVFTQMEELSNVVWMTCALGLTYTLWIMCSVYIHPDSHPWLTGSTITLAYNVSTRMLHMLSCS